MPSRVGSSRMGVERTAGRTGAGRTALTGTRAHVRACQLSTEIHTLLAVMRQSSKWAVSPIFLDETSGADAEDPLLRNLKALRQKIVTDWSDEDWEAARVPPSAYLAPFLDVVRSERTNTIVTSVALSSVLKILNLQFFDESTPGAAVGIHMVMDAVTSCRFEVTDLASEEAVLVKILQVTSFEATQKVFFETPGAAVGIHMVMDAVTSCRFEVTDLTSEEAVLVKILQVTASRLRYHGKNVATKRFYSRSSR
ncbi:unnamed protein product [Closterium sp. Yama58-4]|nr:unnamed protein product [Closterium sp. Yama58-4]